MGGRASLKIVYSNEKSDFISLLFKEQTAKHIKMTKQEMVDWVAKDQKISFPVLKAIQ